MRGSHLKYLVAAASPANPHAATIRTSVPLKLMPRKPAWIPLAKCRTGKIRAIHRIQDGELSPSGINIPERNNSGRMLAFTIAVAASALGKIGRAACGERG